MNLDLINEKLKESIGYSITEIDYIFNINKSRIILNKTSFYKIISLEHCIAFQDTRVSNNIISDIFIKEPGVFYRDFCINHNENINDYLELDIIIDFEKHEGYRVLIKKAHIESYNDKIPDNFWW